MTDSTKDPSPSPPREATRRGFLKAAAFVPVVFTSSVGAGGTRGATPEETETVSRRATLLRAVAGIVLPAAALGDRGLEIAVRGFERWWLAFEPVAELDHAYLSTDELQFGPPDPRPLFSSQLDALQLESEKRLGRNFAELRPDEQNRLVRAALPAHLDENLPSPAQAPHVAIALLAWFAGTPRANDLCYGRAIRRYECRGLPTGPDEPLLLVANPFHDEDV